MQVTVPEGRAKKDDRKPSTQKKINVYVLRTHVQAHARDEYLHKRRWHANDQRQQFFYFEVH